MILYYTGTGNSAYAAKRIAELTGDTVYSLFEKIRSRDYSKISSEKPFVFAVPTYAWQIPHIVGEWIENTEFEGNSKVYFAMTCGGDNGNAQEYLKRLCTSKGVEYMGCAEIVMPENYVAMFDVPNEHEASEIIKAAKPVIEKTAEFIKMGKPFPNKEVRMADKLKSGIVNKVFYKFFVKADKFYTTDECIGCGKCVTVCPLSNIKISDGKPIWGSNCTHCMACICSCPKEAVEYGNISKGKPRYKCPI